MTKNDFRAKYKNLRVRIDKENIQQLSLRIAQSALDLPIWDMHLYHVFLSIPEKKEVDTEALISVLRAKNKTLAIPKTDFKTAEMKHFIFDSQTVLEKTNHNILEPLTGKEIAEKDIDVVFIPLMAFDIHGNRIGYGKGHYDKFLSLCRKDTIKIGVSFFEAEPPFNEVFDTDVRINYCITPERIYNFEPS